MCWWQMLHLKYTYMWSLNQTFVSLSLKTKHYQTWFVICFWNNEKRSNCLNRSYLSVCPVDTAKCSMTSLLLLLLFFFMLCKTSYSFLIILIFMSFESFFLKISVDIKQHLLWFIFFNRFHHMFLWLNASQNQSSESFSISSYHLKPQL